MSIFSLWKMLDLLPILEGTGVGKRGNVRCDKLYHGYKKKKDMNKKEWK